MEKRQDQSRVTLQPLNLSNNSHTSSRTKLKKREVDEVDTMIRKMNASEVIRRSETNAIQRKIAEQGGKSDENADTAAYLHSLKKAHDELVKQTTSKQNETNRLREEIEAIKKKLKQSEEVTTSQKQSREDMQKQLESLKNKQETSAMACKTFDHILDRMKKDEIVNQLKINELQKRAYELRAALNSALSQSRSIHKFAALSAITAETVKKSCMEADRNRNIEMQQYETILRQKMEADRRHQERQKVTDEIQAMAASDLNDANLIKWKKLLLAQKFLKKLLKNKMNCLEEKYKDVKAVYHLVKLKTTVNDPSALAASYFALEDTYKGLLDTIKKLETNGATLERKKKELEKQYQEIRCELFLIGGEGEQSESSADFNTLVKQAHELTEKASHCELTEDKLYFWLINNMHKLDSTAHKLNVDKKKYFEEFPKQNALEAFNRFCLDVVGTARAMCGEQGRVKRKFTELRKLQAATGRKMQTTEQDEEVVVVQYDEL